MAGKFSRLIFMLLLSLLVRAASAAPERNGKFAAPRRRYIPRFVRATESSIPKPLTIRRCDCDETDGCIEAAYKEVTQCKEACQNELVYFGPNTDKYLTCFEENVMEANVIGECLEENSHGYCSLNGTMHQLELELLLAESVNSTENSTSPEASESTTSTPLENADKVYNLIKKANLISLYFVKFETCVVNCLKNHVNACLKDKSCYVKIPKFSTMEDVLFICTKFELLAQYQSQKACQCLAHNHKITKLNAICPILAYTF
uniref:Uncharacterized protein n=1 Tax=Panagrolaimus superbus TaxID=310955 RepID=A0A914YLA8_9BILA